MLYKMVLSILIAYLFVIPNTTPIQVQSPEEPEGLLSVQNFSQEYPIDKLEIPITLDPSQFESTISLPDRTKPIYEVYKNGIFIDVSPSLQWYIHDLCQEYEFDEKIIFSLITTESTWHSGAENNACYGLTQQSTHWVNNKILSSYGVYIEDFAALGISKKEYLLDPYHNIANLIAMWRYAHQVYNLDLSTELGYIKLLYWYATGSDPSKITKFKYSNVVFNFKNELKEV